jgi:hypothetical protein
MNEQLRSCAASDGAHQCVKNLSDFSTSMLGTLKAMTSYGAAWNSRYCGASGPIVRHEAHLAKRQQPC